MVITFFYCLRNIALVAQTIGRPWSTIKSFRARACECQSLDNMPRPGHPPVLSQPVTNQPSVKVFVTGNDYLTIIGYRHSLRSLLRLSL